MRPLADDFPDHDGPSHQPGLSAIFVFVDLSKCFSGRQLAVSSRGPSDNSDDKARKLTDAAMPQSCVFVCDCSCAHERRRNTQQIRFNKLISKYRCSLIISLNISQAPQSEPSQVVDASHYSVT